VIPIPGGFQPRAAVGYSLVAALEAAALCGAAPALRDEVEGAATLAEALAAEWGPDTDGDAKELAERLHGTIPVIAGVGVGVAAAYRWKCQFNENAGLPAFAGALPEIDHNEVVGWPAARDLGPFAAIFLADPGAHPRDTLRTELTAEQARAGADVVEVLVPRGATPVERLISHVLLGDLVSLYLAVLRGKDPIEIAPIQALKAALAAQ
jgi:glucose/mannose-6-phosphate isomerase